MLSGAVIDPERTVCILPNGHSSMLRRLAIMALGSIRKMRCVEPTEKYLHGEVKGQSAIRRLFRR
ncbi:hypothetical protein BVI2075_960014 [Burkholderia vietnamiensis]|nr:hypothetical protein BVI2075_960014 [Burkholderia vietnamiensis]